MRMWRFTEEGTLDALLFDDTFALLGPNEQLPLWLSVSQQNKVKQNFEEGQFDYICIWQNFVFPVYHSETDRRSLLWHALEIRQEDQLVVSAKV